MDSARDTLRRVGCPIRRPGDQRALASPPGFSQRATSFIASQCQGIHQMPFSSPQTAPNNKNPGFRYRISHVGYQTAEPAPIAGHGNHFSRRHSGRPSAPNAGHNPAPAPKGLPPRSHSTRLFTRSISMPAGSHAPREPKVLMPSSAGPWRRRPGGGGPWWRCPGGGERDRTDDLLLAKQALSQLSYTPLPYPMVGQGSWWAREDLNLRPHAYQARALTS